MIRTNDGGWLYADVKAAKRFGGEMLAAGARLTVIGGEASRPFEMGSWADRAHIRVRS